MNGWDRLYIESCCVVVNWRSPCRFTSPRVGCLLSLPDSAHIGQIADLYIAEGAICFMKFTDGGFVRNGKRPQTFLTGDYDIAAWVPWYPHRGFVRLSDMRPQGGLFQQLGDLLEELLRCVTAFGEESVRDQTGGGGPMEYAGSVAESRKTTRSRSCLACANRK